MTAPTVVNAANHMDRATEHLRVVARLHPSTPEYVDSLKNAQEALEAALDNIESELTVIRLAAERMITFAATGNETP